MSFMPLIIYSPTPRMVSFRFMMSTWSSIIFWETSHLPLPLQQNVGVGEGYVAISQNLTLIKAFLPLSLWSPYMGPHKG